MSGSLAPVSGAHYPDKPAIHEELDCRPRPVGNPSTMLEHLIQCSTWQDPLFEALDSYNLHAWVPGPFELTAPWGIEVAGNYGWFHVASGEPFIVEADGDGDKASVAPGDLLLVPQGRGHRLRSVSDGQIIPLEDLLEPRHFEEREPLTYGDGGALTRLSCVCFMFDGLSRNPLLSALPPMIQVMGKGRRVQPYADHILRLIVQESKPGDVLARTIVNRLVRILFVKVVEDYVSEWSDGRIGSLKALVDPSVGRAMGLMHRYPEMPWTVATLAEHVAMSRSAFSTRFKAVTGKPPLEYLTEWRMRRASRLLRAQRAGLKEVAARVGYESVAAFSKAFKRWAGSSPGSHRLAETEKGSRPIPPWPARNVSDVASRRPPPTPH